MKYKHKQQYTDRQAASPMSYLMNFIVKLATLWCIVLVELQDG